MAVLVDSDERRKSDEQLFVEYSKGQRLRSFDVLISRHYQEAVRAAYHILGARSTAEDAAQEAFINLMKSASRYQKHKPFKAWWKGVLYNSIRKEGRRLRNIRKRELKASEQRPELSPDTSLDRLEQQELKAKIQELPEDLKTVIVLRYYEGCSHQDIADILNIPSGTASSRLRRALAALKGALKDPGKLSAALLTGLFLSLSESLEASPNRPRAASLQRRLRDNESGSLGPRSGRNLALGLVSLASVLLVFGFISRTVQDAAFHDGATNSVTSPRALRASAENTSFRATMELEAPVALKPLNGAPAAVPPVKAAASPSPSKLASPSWRLSFRDSQNAPMAGAEVVLYSVRHALEEGAAPNPHGISWERSRRADARGQIDWPRADLLEERFYVYAVKNNELALAGPFDGHALVDQSVTAQPLKNAPGEVCVIRIESPVVGSRRVRFRASSHGRLNTPAWFAKEQTGWLDTNNELVISHHKPGVRRYELQVEGYAPSLSPDLKDRNSHRAVSMRLQPECQLTGQLQWPSSVSLGDIEVFARVCDSPLRIRELRAEIEGDGRYRFKSLPRGQRLEIDARAPGMACETVSLRLDSGSILQSGPTLVLGQGLEIRGRLVDARGQAVTERLLRLVRDVSQPKAMSWRAATDSEGCFSICGLSAGRYTLSMLPFSHRGPWTCRFGHSGEGSLPKRARRFVLSGHDQDFGELSVHSAQRAAIVEGQVCHPDGRPQPFAALSLSFDSEFRNLSCDDAGRFRLLFDKLGSCELRASARSRGSHTRVIDLREGSQSLTLILSEETASIVGRVLELPERSAWGRQVSLIDPMLPGFSMLAARHLRPGRDGRFRFFGLKPGRYTLRLWGASSVAVKLEAGQRWHKSWDFRQAREQLRLELSESPGFELGEATFSWPERDHCSAGFARFKHSPEGWVAKGLPAGQGTLLLRYRGHNFERAETHELSISPGMTTLAVPQPELDLGGQLEAEFKPLFGKLLILVNPRFQLKAMIFKRSGRMQWRRVPLGRYRCVALRFDRAGEEALAEALKSAPVLEIKKGLNRLPNLGR